MCKMIIEIPPITPADSYYLQERRKPAFDYPLHKHNAFELNFVEGSSGARRIVGDSMEVVGEYDMAFIGCNLEHVWEQHECKTPIHEITIQLPYDIFPDATLNRRAMLPIKEMFTYASLGIAFGMKSIMKIYERLQQLASMPPSFHSIAMMYEVLYDLAVSGDYHTLASPQYCSADMPVVSSRIKTVKEYIEQHYSEEIRMDTLAGMVSMTPNALSRFFKQRTNRTISDYINEVRIGQASNLLINTTRSVVDISYQCGYNTISNFNRTFRLLMGVSPSEFRNSYKKNAYLL